MHIPLIAVLFLPAASCTNAPSQPEYTGCTYTLSITSPDILKGDTFTVSHVPMISSRNCTTPSTFTAGTDGHILIQDTITSFTELCLKCSGRTPDSGIIFYAEPGQDISLNTGSLNAVCSIFTGGFYNDTALCNYLTLEAEYNHRLSRCTSLLEHYNLSGKADSVSIMLDSILTIQDRTPQEWNYIISFLESTDSPVAAYLYAKEMLATELTDRTINRHWRRLTPAVQNSGAGRCYYRLMEIRKSIGKGSPAPDFTLTFSDGNQSGKHDLNGKYVILYFWNYCGYVMLSAPDLITLHKKFPETLQVIALTKTDTAAELLSSVSEDSTEAVFRSLLQQDWKTAYIDLPENNRITEDYLMTFTPCVVLISPEGRIIEWGNADVLKTAARTLRRTR